MGFHGKDQRQLFTISFKRDTSDFKILSDTFSSSVSDTCMIIEGMNIIYMSPLKQQSFYGVCQFVSF